MQKKIIIGTMAVIIGLAFLTINLNNIFLFPQTNQCELVQNMNNGEYAYSQNCKSIETTNITGLFGLSQNTSSENLEKPTMANLNNLEETQTLQIIKIDSN
jgi:hypothetical protein